MALLMLFALAAGAGTALSPCVLPILPAVLSAGVTGGRRRPLGVVTGLALSFTFATVALVYVIDALGLPDDIARTIAVAVLLVFGISLLVPAIGDRIEAWASRIAPGPARFRGEGFGSGLAVGASLGLVYAPCAGPILAGVITVSAAQDFTAGRLAVALSYALGSALVLYALMLGGRRLTDRLAPIRGQVQMAMGALMICVAVVMATEADLRFQNAIADDLPAFLVNPTGDLEESRAVAADLDAVSPHGGGAVAAGASQLDQGLALPRLGLAPDFTLTQSWFNTDGQALRMEELRGEVVLIDFWTYTCINCIRTLPYLKAWDSSYRDDGLVIVGVHSPEFPFERDAGNVAEAIEDNEIRYPVVQDNEFGTWTAYGNQYWPAKYLVDAGGQVRYVNFGEGEYETTERAIRTLLREKGDEELGDGARASGESANPAAGTPETYLGAERAEGWVNGAIERGVHDYGSGPRSLGPDQFAYGGRWRIGEWGAAALEDGVIEADFSAEKVFLVLGSPGEARSVEVLLDGEPVPARLAGEDVDGGAATIRKQRLYRLIDLPEAGRHRLELRLDTGVSGYAFTFG
ncbi:MAG: cytochrome c biogenesis protein DipZ [Actinobacteria bacterium]|nr:cytochrome c biogenesis protein DipZ [Actinomycetota bacterium]